MQSGTTLILMDMNFSLIQIYFSFCPHFAFGEMSDDAKLEAPNL
jgi:hypothetical protein